jgi:hypothetical protein
VAIAIPTKIAENDHKSPGATTRAGLSEFHQLLEIDMISPTATQIVQTMRSIDVNQSAQKLNPSRRDVATIPIVIAWTAHVGSDRPEAVFPDSPKAIESVIYLSICFESTVGLLSGYPHTPKDTQGCSS